MLPIDQRGCFVVMWFEKHITNYCNINFISYFMGGKTKRAMLSERSEVGSRDVSVSYGAMS